MTAIDRVLADLCPRVVLDQPIVRSAVLSPCGSYRYELRRTWADGPVCGWIMLNPSTADAAQDDPTIRRCMGFARRWGFAGIVVRNLYGLRTTNPTALRTHPDPVGPDNERHLARVDEDALTVCAWGVRGGDRGLAMVRRLATDGLAPAYLALTQAGAPRHPLYLRSELTPVPFSPGWADSGEVSR